MLRGLEVAGAGLAMERWRSEVATHNLANIATPDYQRRTVAAGTFTDLLVRRLDGAAGDPPAVGAVGAGPAPAADQRDDAPPSTSGGSNVEPGQEMVDLMSALRTFEAIQRAVQAQDEATRKAATELGRV